MYRLIALDVDGTLVDSEDRITPAVREAVRAAVDRGVCVTLATGRRFIAARHVASDLAIEAPLILHGGAVIQDSATGEVLYQDPHDRAVVRQIVATMAAHGRPAIVYESPRYGGRLFLGRGFPRNRWIEAYEDLRGPFGRIDETDLDTVRDPLSVTTLDDPGLLEPLAREIRSSIPANALHTRWHTWDCDAIEVFRAGCSKATAVSHFAAGLGIEMSQVVAIGDGLNDVELLTAAGLGVAMGNAVPEARAAADVEVAGNDRDGVAEAIWRYVLA